MDAGCSELFLKINRPGVLQIDNTREITFYNKLVKRMDEPPIPLVLEAVYHEELKMGIFAQPPRKGALRKLMFVNSIKC
jgi:hypothetical protein